jgi:hypothetical protein
LEGRLWRLEKEQTEETETMGCLQPQEEAGFSLSFLIRFKDQRRNLYNDEVQMARKGLFSSIGETTFVRKKRSKF